MKRRAAFRYVNRYNNFAILAIARGRKEEAIEWLRQALDQREAGILSLGYDPIFSELRGDPRVQELVASTGVRTAGTCREPADLSPKGQAG